MTFKELNLCGAIVRALDEKGYQSPTAIQRQTIPQILSGKDIVASAATGTGKMASFCIPILEALSVRKQTGGVRAYYVAREDKRLLLKQLCKGPLRVSSIY